MKTEYAIEFRNISKTFGPVIANNDVSFGIKKGEILALLGENGSGKTTLMNMLSGIYFPDKGQILINGTPVSILSPKDAFSLGIGMIHQHFKLVDVFTAAENIVLGITDKKAASLKYAVEKIKSICNKYGLYLDPFQKVYDMSVSEKQTLEIIKVLYRGADILILDEPTAVLTPQEARNLFAIIKNMRNDGKAIVVITHKLQEVLSVSDRVAVLRKGEYIDTVETKTATELSLTELMVGTKVELDIERPDVVNPKPKIEIKNLSINNKDGFSVLKDISLEINSGEILGIAGISGCGQKELLEAIAGLQNLTPESSITFYSDYPNSKTELVGKSPRQIRALGVSLSFVPEDRLGMGLIGSMGMTENMMLKDYHDSDSFFVKKQNPKILAESIMKDLGVITPGVDTPIRRLSGGNVQKVLVGREISSKPTVLMTAYAVRGLDINTSYTIYHLLNEQKKQGVAVIYVGEDLDVLLALADRIVVLCRGEVSGILDARTASKEDVGLLMTKTKSEENYSE